MKQRLLSVFLLVVMYLNIMGYYWVLVGLHYNSTVSLEKKLNAENYAEHETVTFRFPLTIPYSPGGRGFERAEGQFEYNGEYYHLIKQQYANDTLQLICIKNHETRRINQTLTNYVKTFADQPSHPGKNTKDLPSLLKEYLLDNFGVTQSSAGWTRQIQFGCLCMDKLFSYRDIISPPPDQI